MIKPVVPWPPAPPVAVTVTVTVSEGGVTYGVTPPVPTFTQHAKAEALMATAALNDEQLVSLRENFARGLLSRNEGVVRIVENDATSVVQAPLPMVLHCPKCGRQHIDEPNFDKGWTNPPHKSHLCVACGTIWRPADVPTTGVAAVRTRGSADTWPK